MHRHVAITGAMPTCSVPPLVIAPVSSAASFPDIFSSSGRRVVSSMDSPGRRVVSNMVGMIGRPVSPATSPTLTPEVTPMTPEEVPMANPILDALVNAAPLEEAISMVASQLGSQDGHSHKVTLASSSRAQASSSPDATGGTVGEPGSEACEQRSNRTQGRRARTTKEQPRAQGIGAPIDIARKSVRARLAPSAQKPVAGSTEGQRSAKEQPQPPASTTGRTKASSGSSRTEATGSTASRYGGQPRQSPRSNNALPRQSSPSPPPRSCRRGTASPSLQQGSEQIGSSSGSRSSAKVSSPRSSMDRSRSESGLGTSLRVNRQPWSIASSKKSSPWASSTPKAASSSSNLSRVAEEYDNDVLPASGQHEALASALSSMQNSIQSMYEDKVSASTRRILRGCKLGSLSAPALRKGIEPRAHQGFVPSERSSSSSTSPTPILGGRRYSQDGFERTAASEFGVLEQECSWGSEGDSRSEAASQKPSRWFSGRLVDEEQNIPMTGGDKLNGPTDCIDEEEIPPYLGYVNGEKLLNTESCIDASSALSQTFKAFAEKLHAAGTSIDETDLSYYMDQATSLGPREFIAGAFLDQASGEKLMASSDCVDEIDGHYLDQAQMDCIHEDHLPVYMETTAADELPEPRHYVADKNLPSYLEQSLGAKLLGATGRADDATDRTIYLEHAPSSISPSRNYSQQDDISAYLFQAGGDLEELPISITPPGGCSDANDLPIPSCQAGDDASITQNTDVDEVVDPHAMSFQERRAVFEKADLQEPVETEEPRIEPMMVDTTEAGKPDERKSSISELTRRMEKLMAVLAPNSPCSLQAD